jgi:hypothetical protein
MTKYRYRGRDVDEDEALDERGSLRDGYAVTVPMTMRDGGMTPLQRSVAEHAARLHDGRARVTDADGGTLGLHRPGYRIADNAAMRDAKQQALDEYENWLTNAWRRGPEVGDARKIVKRDPQGRIAASYEEENDDDNELRDAASHDGMTLDELQRDHQRSMAREYQAYDNRIEQQWCNP